MMYATNTALGSHPQVQRIPFSDVRDLRIDTLRGLMLVAMAVNHLDTELRVLTDHVYGFVSTAEGFVFLSGLVTGIVYTRALLNPLENNIVHRGFARARKIYYYQLLCVVGAFFSLVVVPQLHGSLLKDPRYCPPLFYEHPIQGLVAAFALLYQPGLLDILPMYCLFLIGIPFLLKGMRGGYAAPILLGSFLIWMLAQAGLYSQLTGMLPPHLPIQLSSFDPFAWQLVFVAGGYFGFKVIHANTPVLSFRPILLTLCLGVTGVLWAIKNNYVPLSAVPIEVWLLSDKGSIGPLRLLNFITVAYLIAAVATLRPAAVICRPLAFLGRHSLQVFSFQAVLALILLSNPALFGTFNSRTATALILVCSLFVPAYLHSTYLLRKRRQSHGMAGSLPTPAT